MVPRGSGARGARCPSSSTTSPADATAVLSFDTTVAEWRDACDLLGPKKLAEGLNEDPTAARPAHRQLAVGGRAIEAVARGGAGRVRLAARPVCSIAFE
jgi:hypothetical protein